MPYGLENKYDTPENNAWMERCVKSVMDSNPDYEKGRAISICKVQLKRKGSSEEISEVSLRDIDEMFYRALNPEVMQPAYPSSAYPVDIYDDYAIISKGSKYFRVRYTLKENDVVIDWDNVVEVVKKVSYEVAADNIPRKTAHVRKNY